MTTRTKLNIASLTASAMMFLNFFSRPLGIPQVGQTILILGAFLPLGFVFYYIKKIKEEKTSMPPEIELQNGEISLAQNKAQKRFIIIWIGLILYSLAAPLWLPISGINLGIKVNFMIGVFTAIVMSAIFMFRFKTMQKQK